MSKRSNDEITWKIHYEDLPRRKVTYYYTRSLVARSRYNIKHYTALLTRTLLLLNKTIKGIWK